MGIGNSPTSIEPYGVDISLPLMGIGNIEQDLDLSELGLLITPHGDREHERRYFREIRQSLSLPLMGIGNQKLPESLSPC